jgi:hypothetical protein
VGAEFTQQNHRGVLYDDPTGVRAAAPSFLSVNGVTYMFYEQGDRLNARIAYAVESAAPVESVTLDNTSAGVTVTGAWTASTGVAGYYGTNFLHDGNAGKGTKTVRYTPRLAGGTYRVYARWTAHANRATNTPFVISGGGGAVTVFQNQRVTGGQWVLLGNYAFAPGTSGYVQIGTGGTNGYVAADAVRFER